MTADLKKFSHDFKMPSNADSPKDRENVSLKSEHPVKGSNAPTGGNSSKSKSPQIATETIPVKDKNENFGSQLAEESSQDNETTDQTDIRRTDSVEPAGAQSPNDSSTETEIAKKSTLNPNAKTFTPRSPMTPLSTSATPPSVASTPSSTVSVPISGNHLTHTTQNLSQGHTPLQVGPQQSAQHTQQRFQIPLVQNQLTGVFTGGLPTLLHNQYLMTNVTAMAPQFTQSNPNQQRTVPRRQRAFRPI